eukprot:5311116-Pyramimonas_sp.AAC.1
MHRAGDSDPLRMGSFSANGQAEPFFCVGQVPPSFAFPTEEAERAKERKKPGHVPAKRPK